jgi:putative transposase
MEKFQNKYRISSARLQNHDYGSCGMYFVTICTRNRENYFGKIITSGIDNDHFEMKLSETGCIVESEWQKTPEVRPDMNLIIDEYQIMPNHFHAILIIGDNEFNTNKTIHDPRSDPADPRRDAMLASLNNHTDTDAMLASLNNYTDTDAMFASQIKPDSISDSDSNPISELENQMIMETSTDHKNKFAPQSKNLGSIMRGFKSAVTSYSKDHNVVFGWQPRYYDHIIRNYNEYQRIANYIRNNPANWGNDRLR